MKKLVISTMAICAMFFSGVVFSYLEPVSAEESLEEIQKQIEDLMQQQEDAKTRTEDVDKEQVNTREKIELNVEDQFRINEQIKLIDDQVARTQSELRDKEFEIKMTEEAMARKEIEIIEMKKRIDNRNEMLRKRFRNLQKNGGGISYLDVVMGAKSFGDFLDRASAVTKIMSQDKRIMEQQSSEKVLMEAAKVELEVQKRNLISQKEELVSLNDELENKRKEKSKLMIQLKMQKRELEEYKIELEEEEDLLRKQQEVIKDMIQNAKNEEERLKELAIKNGGSGGFALPVPPSAGRLTSPFGERWGSFHHGIDIGKRVFGEQVEIWASADGVVSRSYYSSTYGNVVFLTHYIDGEVFTTLYSHMQNREVSEGQQVKQGQRLGFLGNTGRSFGPHLHFEIHEGPWLFSKENAVDPLKYVKF